MAKESFIIDKDTNTLMIVWPSIYRDKIFWHDLIRIYYEIINIAVSNRYMIILIHHKNINIENNLYEANYKLSDIHIDYNKFITFYEYNFDDIWIRDYGPKISNSGVINHGYNGYGNKYNHYNDKMFFNDVIKRYSLNHKYLINEVIIEGGNIINSNNDYIFNKNSIIKHNSLSWNTIESKIKSVFDKKINGNYYFVNVQELTGDDTDGHIDNLVRFKDDNTILYMATNDKKHPDYKTLKELKKQLEEIIIKSNNIDSMIAVNHDIKDIVKSLDGDILPFSYLNYIEVGDLIIIPVNKNTGKDKKQNIKGLFPNHVIFFLESTALLNEFGGLHCCSNNFIL
ncbi:MAG: hypothetical protein HOI56_02260 [Gammaproteobacteria bacterium]|jgi:agmatine/peptidylarginine deiminase|nr:hypothetical protein [Gammaproteobacteria bacterium]MBT4462110.1 hypothetical protein [Gammaproteobacteria bacterium]MBT4654969.1 hypothetical protein [Gammaproteobacteria bacterium]MBT5116517.1 hypothetical protein [Gammaproteobacteria bacterium]MBT5761546.1 hypothetical protein [Gammaproteobacteria bacterium]